MSPCRLEIRGSMSSRTLQMRGSMSSRRLKKNLVPALWTPPLEVHPNIPLDELERSSVRIPWKWYLAQPGADPRGAPLLMHRRRRASEGVFSQHCDIPLPPRKPKLPQRSVVHSCISNWNPGFGIRGSPIPNMRLGIFITISGICDPSPTYAMQGSKFSILDPRFVSRID